MRIEARRRMRGGSNPGDTALSPSRTVDVIVLGAGIVGVSAAIHLQARGRSAAIVDRLGEAAGETSFGNSGIVQSEAVVPYVFPRSLREIALAALNRDPRAQIRYRALPWIAPALWRYFQASTPARKNETAQGDGRVRRRRERRTSQARATRRAPARCCARPAGSKCFAARAARMRFMKRSRN